MTDLRGAMSSQPLQVELPTGEIIWARVAVDGPQNVASHSLQRLDVEALSRTVRGMAASLRAAVDDLAPDEVQVEFGLELALKSGQLISMLAEAGGTASVNITLAWKGEPATAPAAPGTPAPQA
jgi:hypothetical protein